MQLAVQKNAYDSVKVLLTHSADVNIQDHKVGSLSSFLCKYMHRFLVAGDRNADHIAWLVLLQLFEAQSRFPYTCYALAGYYYCDAHSTQHMYMIVHVRRHDMAVAAG